MEYYQQGDVLLKVVKSIPEKVEVVKSKIVAEGEVTGHMHRIIDNDSTVYVTKEGNIFVDVAKEAIITHDEHNTISLPTGKYQVGIVREFDPLEKTINEVRD